MENHAPIIQNRLTREAIHAFPVKSKDMTTAEMRQLCADFFRFSKQALWVCDHDVDYYCNAALIQDRMEEGQVYGGLPYIRLGTGNVYRTLDYMDENGVVNISGVINKKKFNKVYSSDLFRSFGNQSANAAYVGWSRVINSADFNGASAMLQANGFLRVGPYTYPDDLASLTTAHNSVAICRENGEQTMFESYAALQLADGLVSFTAAGHVMMCTVPAVVVRNADGSINGKKSYICITEQSQQWTKGLTEGGQEYLTKPSVDDKRTFAKLYEEGCLPFTFPEFLGKHPIEDTLCTVDLQGDTVTAKELFNAHIKSNYGILDAYAIITDDGGKEVCKHAVRCLQMHCLELPFIKRVKDPKGYNNVDIWGEPPVPGTYHLEMIVQLATGERPTVYKGKLVVEKAVVTDPLTWDKIHAFPIKYKGMPVAQRRQLCADFFRFQKRVSWTPLGSHAYPKNPNGTPDKMYEGTVYRGFPYVTRGTGNVYRLMDFIDENGYIDIQRAATPPRNFGHQCASGVFGAWGRLVNSPKYTHTVAMTVKNGFQRVGPYTYDDEQPRFGGENATTYDICERNGEQVMFRSYAAMEIADVLVNYRNAGHIIMCTIAPEVIYNEDGTVNGDESFMHTTEQGQTWMVGNFENGDEYLYKNSVDRKMTFTQLLSSGYLPMTVPELTGEKDLEDTVCTIDLAPGTVTMDELLAATVTANYGITDIYAIVSENGREVYKLAVRAYINSLMEISFAAEPQFIDTWGVLPKKGCYDLKVVAQLYTGERPELYNGKLKIAGA